MPQHDLSFVRAWPRFPLKYNDNLKKWCDDNNYNDACSAYGLTDCKITKQKLVDRQILKDDQRTMYRSLDFNFDPNELLQMENNQK